MALLLSARFAGAHVVNPDHCTIPARITVAGHLAGTPDPGATFEVLVLDYGQPLSNVTIQVVFDAVPDIRLSADVASAGATTECGPGHVLAFTGMDGIARFTIVGAGRSDPPQCLGSGTECDGRVRIYADGVLLGAPRVSVLDLDGAGGVGGGDLAIWLQDFGGSLHPARSDYDGNGAVDGGDLSLWLAHFGSGGSAQSAGVYCP